jgi:hypothetical protein
MANLFKTNPEEVKELREEKPNRMGFVRVYFWISNWPGRDKRER